MKNLIDKFVEIDLQLKELSQKRESLRKKLEKLEAGTHYGNKYAIKVSEVEVVEYDVRKVANLLKKDTLKVVKVVSSELKKYVSPTELPKLVKSRSIRKRIQPTVVRR